MKRLSKASNSRSSKTRATSAHVTEPVDDLITTQKPKFAFLHQQVAANYEAVADDVDDEDVAEDQEEEDEQTGYVLRQKPRKNILRSENNVVNQDQQKKFICSKCGKGFQSSKAMCGHMACHSEKEKPLRNNVYAKRKQLQLVMDSQSDTESGAKNNNLRIRRSRRMIGYKKVDDDNPAADSKAKVDVFNNCSSGDDSVVEQEQEEVAISLMMLSRDSANWCGLNSIGDSSDNNSIVLEDRSVGTYKLGKKDGLRRFEYNVDESKKVETLGDSESGSVRNGDKNVGSDPKIRILKKRKLDEGSKHAEPHLSLKKLKSVMDGGFKYGLSRDSERWNQTERPKMDSYPRKSVANESYTAGYNVAANQYSNAEIYRAFNANATPNHKSSTVENSFENDGSSNTRKGKGILEYRTGNVGDNWKIGKHECPISSKVFRSGQARSSHRRVHLAERSEEINKCDEVSTTNFKRNGDKLHDFIDLNLPAPMEDEETRESMGSYSRFLPLHF